MEYPEMIPLSTFQLDKLFIVLPYDTVNQTLVSVFQ